MVRPRRPTSRRAVLIVAGSIVLALLVALSASFLIATKKDGAVYLPSELRVDVTNNPSKWIRRAVRVRGMPIQLWTASQPPKSAGYMLVDPPAPGAPPDPSTFQSLPLRRQQSPLYHIPFLSALLPHPQQVIWGITAVFDAQVQSWRSTDCGGALCYGLVLVNTAPFPSGPVPLSNPTRLFVPNPSKRSKFLHGADRTPDPADPQCNKPPRVPGNRTLILATVCARSKGDAGPA